VTPDHGFSPAQIDELRAQGIALFAGRVIFDAQPPMDEAAIDAVQARCSGPLPPGLLALWRQTAGGRLAYDLDLEVETRAGRRIEAISWTELFHDGSDGYRDLWGWIEHELEQAEAAIGDAFDGRLDYLPFGGFEYCDRLYAATSPAASHPGGILAWKMGLPPAWAPALTEDAVTTFAPDLHAAFSALVLHADPLGPDAQDHGSVALLEYLDTRCDDHDLPRDLADAVIAHYRRAWIDWRGALRDGRLAADAYALRLALRHAVERDDADLLQQIRDSGARLDGLLIGGDDALRYARFLQRTEAGAALTRLVSI
jgi:hypothetical protein